MPEPAGTRSLEDILASIRQSLADETVDGLVQLSAAAAAAARAEVSGGARQPRADAELLEAEAEPEIEDALKDKLAGALAVEEELTLQLSTALRDDAAAQEADEEDAVAAAHASEAEAEPTATADPVLSKLWFLRPGAPEEAANAQAEAAPLRLDAFPDRDLTAPPSEKAAAALFALSARAIVGDSPAPPPPAAQPTASALPDGADDMSGAAKRQVPRLDANQIEMINKLKASSAADVESITSEGDVVDLRPAAEPPSGEPEPEPVLAASETPAVQPATLSADTAIEPSGPTTFLSRPERSTPLFVAANERSRPIVSAPPLTDGASSELSLEREDIAPQADPEPEAAELISAEPAPAVVPGRDPDVEDVLEPDEAAVALTASVEEPAAPAASNPASVAGPSTPDIHTIKTVAAPVPQPPPAVAIEQELPAEARPLEEMIASVLEPVLQRLLEKNLGPMIEAMVRREVEKALQPSQDA